MRFRNDRQLEDKGLDGPLAEYGSRFVRDMHAKLGYDRSGIGLGNEKHDRQYGLGKFARRIDGSNFKRRRFLREAKQMADVLGMTFEAFIAKKDAVNTFWSKGGQLHTPEQYSTIIDRRRQKRKEAKFNKEQANKLAEVRKKNAKRARIEKVYENVQKFDDLMRLIDFEVQYVDATRSQINMVNAVDDIIVDSTVRVVDKGLQQKARKVLDKRKNAIADKFKDARVSDMTMEKIARIAKLSEKWNSRLPDIFQAATRVHDDYFEILREIKRTLDKDTVELIFSKIGVSQHVFNVIEDGGDRREE